MTLTEALEKAGTLFDEVAARNLVNAEEMLRHHGADDEELAIELARLKAQHAADRIRMLATVVAMFYCWRPEDLVWEAQGSPSVH